MRSAVVSWFYVCDHQFSSLLLGSILPRIKSQSKSSIGDGWGSSIQKLQTTSGDHTCDYLPEELLLVLTQPPPPSVDLGPPTRHRNLNVSNVRHPVFSNLDSINNKQKEKKSKFCLFEFTGLKGVKLE